MLQDLHLAKQELLAGDCALVLVNQGIVIARGYGKGIKPLFDLTEDPSRIASLRGAALADRVIGRGAALLCAYRGISVVYAQIISEPAVEELRRAGVSPEYDQLVPRILNQTRTGYCPVETLVNPLTQPAEAVLAIRDFLRQMSSGPGR